MKNWKGVLTGFVAGILCTGAVAAAAGVTVQTNLMDNARIFVDGQLKAMPEGQNVLNYNDRIYVPIRFVAEATGATINWDATNNYGMVTTNPKVVEKIVEVPVEKIVYVEKSEESSTTKTYKKLPIQYETDEYVISVTGISRRTNDNTTKVFVTVENKEDNTNTILLRNWKCTLNVDGKDYAYNNFNAQCELFDNSINPGEKVEGYLLFNIVPEDYKNCDLMLMLQEDTSNTGSFKEKHFYFRVNS